MKDIRVVAAVIVNDNKVYCARRADKGELALKWEFPGGKVEHGETNEQALIREIKEELDSTVSVLMHLTQVKHQYKGFHLTMDGYLCDLVDGELELSEHVESLWLPINNNLYELDWAAADIPIIDRLIEVISIETE